MILTITFTSTITVARLVGPTEYGLAAMSIVVFTFAQVFRDFGVTNAVLRKGHVTRAELNVIFWFNVATTTLLSLALVGLAPLVARFYGQPIIYWTMLCSIAGFQVGGIALQHRALINRALRFGSIAIIDVGGLLVGFAVTLVLAVIRHDVWALVIGNVAQSLTSACLAIVLSGWRPGRPSRGQGLRELVKFGANSTVHSLSILVSNNAAVVLVGHQLGPQLLGQYSRAQTLFALPSTNLVQPLTQSTMPLLTRLRSRPSEYRVAYLGLVSRLCVCLMPMSVMLAFVAVPLTRLLLGDRWDTAGLVLTALAPTLCFTGIAFAAADIFITQDRSRELRNLGLFELVVRVGAVALGVQFGVVSTAIAFAAATATVVVARVAVAGRSGPVTTRDQFAAASTGLLPGAGAGALCVLAYFLLPPTSELLQVAVLGSTSVVGAVLGVLATYRSRSAAAELLVGFGLGRFMPRRLLDR